MYKMPLGSKGLGTGGKDTACCKKKCQAKGKHDVTESVNTCSCLEPACIATFKTIEEADEHMDTGHHILTPEKETIYDNLRRQ